MSNESGLKKRNVNTSNLTDFKNNDSKNNDDKDNSDKEKNEENDDEYDADSKETRLTLMEEILLLGLKDREVGFTCFD
jgi:hypothetical protein